jgi:hypothetical protein
MKTTRAARMAPKATFGNSLKMENEIMEVAVVDVVETMTVTLAEAATEEGIGEVSVATEAVVTVETETREVVVSAVASEVVVEMAEKSRATPVWFTPNSEERILSAVEQEEPCDLYYLNIFNLNYDLTEEEITEFYASHKVEVTKVHKPNRDAADLEFKTKQELIKAIEIGDYSLKGRTVYTRSSFFNGRGQTGGPPRGRGYGGYSRGRGDRGDYRGGRSERFGSDSHNDRDRSQDEPFQKVGGGDFQDRGGYNQRSRGGGSYGRGFGGDRFRRDDGPREWENRDGGRGAGGFRPRGGRLDFTKEEEMAQLLKME